MNKIVKKLKTISLMICAVLFIPAIVSYAAEGTIAFSDPTGKVGEEILVKVKMEAGGSAIGDGQATISYDSTKLEFVNGTNATGGNGTIELSASGTGTETELAFELNFKALAEGSTNIEVTSSTAYLFSDETLNLTPGTGVVTIEGADGTTAAGTDSETGKSGERQVSEANVEVLGTMYGIYENFTEALIPEGFSKTTINYNGGEHNAIIQDVSGEIMVYLIAGENDPVMAVYNEEKSSFVIAEQIGISDEFFVFVLSEGDASTLPEQFQEANIEINGTNFPAWQNMNAKEYYLVYALSSGGTKGYYEYDSIEGTYQRYVFESMEKAEKTKEDSPVLAKVKELVDHYFLIMAAVIAALLLILFIVIIVLTVKLSRRNAELDSFYDDYDDDDESGEEFSDDDYEDDDGYDNDEYEDNYDDEYDDDYDDDEYEDDYDDDEYEDDYDDDDDDDRKQKYDVDFIDL
ncbi:cohesin domain-containing protein [Mediterraneibacter agrestimuris]|uniref:cohesin domain-containing protein n=1 Tax=Mediterraneibacter agrestimuris TaxID=2941333 RepID=UPI00203E55FC|nr:cohesin domain-containing protein [Mediterraneibacter agrestimuris]